VRAILAHLLWPAQAVADVCSAAAAARSVLAAAATAEAPQTSLLSSIPPTQMTLTPLVEKTTARIVWDQQHVVNKSQFCGISYLAYLAVTLLRPTGYYVHGLPTE
jgi:hypothetical protein